MGIKGFSKVFEKSSKEIKLSKIKDKSVAVDASIIMFKSCLGMNNINALTDSNGNSTIHINVIISKILNFEKCNIKQYWVFDYFERGYENPDKVLEHTKRKTIKDNSIKKLKKLTDQKLKNDLFSESDEDTDNEEISKKDTDDKLISKKDTIQKQIYTQEKIGFSINDRIVSDTKYILDCFNIPWCDSLKNVEAESVCSALTNTGLCDSVFSTDTDAMAYGAKELIRDVKVAKKKALMSYKLSDVLSDNSIDINDLRKIAVILGTDHAVKTKGIGIKTVLKKFKDVELTEGQLNAIKIFETPVEISKLKWNNDDDENSSDELYYDTPFIKHKINKLLNWLEGKSFNRERIEKQIKK